MNQLFPNYVHLSPEDLIEQLHLTNRSFNALKRAGIQTVGEALQLVESDGLGNIPALGRKSILEIEDKLAQIKSEVKSLTKIDTISARNDGYLSPEDTIEKLNLSNRSFNPLKRAGIRTIEQALQLIESDELQTVRGLGTKCILEIKDELAQVKIPGDSEVEANIDVIPHQNNVFLSRKDSIEKLNLSSHSFNVLVHAGIQTVGEALQLIESNRLKTIRELGTQQVVSACMLEIAATLVQVKILDDNQVENLTKKDEIPWIVVGWQAQLVSKQLSRGLLHEEAIIAEKSIKNWIADIEKIDSDYAYEVLATILGSSLNVCEDIEFFLNQIPRQHRMTILLSTYGFETKTLKQIGSELGLSRGRVSQIRSELKNKVTAISDLKNRPALLRMQSALLIAKDLGLDITYEGWTQRIRSSGLVGDWTSQDFVSTDAVEVMIAICNLLADCELGSSQIYSRYFASRQLKRIDYGLSSLQMPENLQYAVQLATEGKPNIPAKISHALDTLPDEAKRLINGHTKNSGGVHVKWLSQESGVELENIKNILQWQEYKALSEDWFVPNFSQTSYNSVFHRCLRKMCQYCGPLSIDDVCAGLRHVVSERKFPVPPPDVMDEIVRIFDYKCKEGLYYWDGESDEKLKRC